jgi:hypothetical protein
VGLGFKTKENRIKTPITWPARERMSHTFAVSATLNLGGVKRTWQTVLCLMRQNSAN